MVLLKEKIDFEKCVTESLAFFKMLYHDNKNSLRAICTFDKSSRYDVITRFSRDVFSTNMVDSHSFKDTYASCHLFYKNSRKSDACRQITSIFIDLDCHSSDLEYIKICKGNTLNIINESIKNNSLYAPTFITDTGRGLGIYYVLDNAIAITKNTKKMVKLWEFVSDGLANKYERLLNLKSDVLEVDKSVLKDKSRICRIPGTYNTKANAMCHICYFNTDAFGMPKYSSLQDMKKYIFDTLEIKPVITVLDKKPEITISVKTERFLNRRMKMLYEFQHNNSSINKREVMCFIFFNSAIQSFPIDIAIKELSLFNKGFARPLCESELKHVVRSVTSCPTGFYHLSNIWIRTNLGIDGDEFPESRESIRIRKREERKALRESVVKAICDGFTYQAIADTYGISLRTVKNYAKAANITRRIITPKESSSFVDKKVQKTPSIYIVLPAELEAQEKEEEKDIDISSTTARDIEEKLDNSDDFDDFPCVLGLGKSIWDVTESDIDKLKENDSNPDYFTNEGSSKKVTVKTESKDYNIDVNTINTYNELDLSNYMSVNKWINNIFSNNKLSAYKGSKIFDMLKDLIKSDILLASEDYNISLVKSFLVSIGKIKETIIDYLDVDIIKKACDYIAKYSFGIYTSRRGNVLFDRKLIAKLVYSLCVSIWDINQAPDSQRHKTL